MTSLGLKCFIRMSLNMSFTIPASYFSGVFSAQICVKAPNCELRICSTVGAATEAMGAIGPAPAHHPPSSRKSTDGGPKRSGLLAVLCNCLAGSFSAVSYQNFARKYAFDNIFQALQDLHTLAPLLSQNFRKKSV